MKIYKNQYFYEFSYTKNLNIQCRFGIIAAVKTIKDVKKGDEFLVHYGYPIVQGPRWYKKLFEEHSKKNPGASTNFDYMLDNISRNNEINFDEDFDSTVKQKRKMKNLLGSTYWY